MSKWRLKMKCLDGIWCICRLHPDAGVPGWAVGKGFLSITRTDEELSVVCRQAMVPAGIVCERDWRILKIEGQLDFALVGILSSVSTILADHGVSLFAVSTFNTDYILVKGADLGRAVQALEAAGITVLSEDGRLPLAVRLVEALRVTAEQYEDYIGEWERAGERIVPYASRRIGSTFEEQLAAWANDQTDRVRDLGLVPATLYFLMDEEDRIIGAIHFRHELNDTLLATGGHIGYGVRPSERRKGHADHMLSMLLEKLAGGGPQRVLVTCDDGNIASARTIEKHGGVLEDIVSQGETRTRRYWIEIRRIQKQEA